MIVGLETRLSNASGRDMNVWLEPWAEEFALPPRAELLIRCWSEDPVVNATPEIDVNDEAFVIYGAGDTRMAVFIDGVDQHSFSADCTAPDARPLTTRGFVNIVFQDQPGARPGGASAPPSRSFVHSALARLFRRRQA